MMLGCGEPAAGDPQLDSLPSVGDEAPRLPSFDWDRGRHAITAHQLVDLLRNRFFNVLLVDASSEGPGAAQIAGRQMDAPAVGTVTRQQPQKPDSWLASTMDRHKEYPPIVGSRRFLSLSRTRDAVRFVSLAKLAEEDKRASVGPDGEQGALFGDETAINGDELVDGKSPSSSGKKKRDSGVDLRDQGESCTDESDASDDEEDLELVKMQTFAKEMQEDIESPRRTFSRGDSADFNDPSQLIVNPEDLLELDKAVYSASLAITDPHWQRRLHGITVIIDEYGTHGGFAHRLSESLAREIADEFDPNVGSLIGRDSSREEVTCPRCSESQQGATECLFPSEDACKHEWGDSSDGITMPGPPQSAFRSAMSFSVAHFSAGHPFTLYLAGGLRSFRRQYPHLCLDHPCPKMDDIRNHQDRLVDAVWYGRLPGGHANDHPVEIVPHLFLGSAHAALSRHLEGYNIGMVIRLGSFSPASKREGVEYIDLEIDDAVSVHISGLFDSVCEIIANRIGKGVNVLVHCHAGVSRSATIVLAYLLVQSSGRFGPGAPCECHAESEPVNFKNLRQAFHYVFVRRPIVRPNEGFCKQLQSLEMALFGTDETTMPRWWMFASYLYGTDWIEHVLRDEAVLQIESSFMEGYESATEGSSGGFDHIYRYAADMSSNTEDAMDVEDDSTGR